MEQEERGGGNIKENGGIKAFTQLHCEENSNKLNTEINTQINDITCRH